MSWKKEAITDGEIDALHKVALAACNDDTRYPLWRGSSRNAQGECLNIASWLVSRLGGTVGVQRGHYVWLSPDDGYIIDLTGAHTGSFTYEPNAGRFHPLTFVSNARTQRFTNRANRIFDSLDRLLRFSDVIGDAYPAEEPQRADDLDRFNDSWTDPSNYWHDEPEATTPTGIYQFIYVNGQLDVSPNHSHDDLAQHAGIDPAAHTGPFAAGHVTVTSGKATWEVQSNVNLRALLRVFKDATKDYGWGWGGMTDAQGQPITDEFAPKRSGKVLNYVHANDQLYLGRTTAGDLLARAPTETFSGPVVSGRIVVNGNRATVYGANDSVLPHLFDWAIDTELILYAGNDNVIKTIPDDQEANNYDPQGDWNPAEPTRPDERLPSGLYRCPGCNRLMPNWHEYSRHRPECPGWADSDNPDANGDNDSLPSPDPGVYGDGAHFTEMRQEPGINTGSVRVLPARTWKEAARVDGFHKYAHTFGYDNDDWNFYVAYHNGDPISYAVVNDEGGIHFVHSSVENAGGANTLLAHLQRYYSSLYTNALHGKTEDMLKRAGWVQSKGQLYRWAAGQDAKDLIEAPLPFIYDVKDDKITVGHPGARTSDIPGQFTPGGIVEGQYEPGGKVVIRTMTSYPYTVRHMIELWYYTNPQLEVKSVHLQDDSGKDTRLAHRDLTQAVWLAATINPAAWAAYETLKRHGGVVYAVGGVVRDTLAGRESHDIDLLVQGLPADEVEKALDTGKGLLVRKANDEGDEGVMIGKDFGVFRYRRKGHEVEVALPRTERSTGPGHNDFEVKTDHTMQVEADLERRDFTVNAMAVNLTSPGFVDPHGGAADLAANVLRTVHANSLAEDPLRIIRGLVAHARFGFQPDEVTREQMRTNAQGLENLPVERIQEELDKLFAATSPVDGIRLAHDTGVLGYFLPEVEACFGYDQNNPHHEVELGSHLLNVLSRVCEKTDDPDLRLAALLHDIGKPASAWTDPQTGNNHFYEFHERDEKGQRTGKVLGANHESKGAQMARERLNALCYPKSRIARIVTLIENHMYPGFSTAAGARRFLAKVDTHAEDLFTLRWADQGGKFTNSNPEKRSGAWDVDNNRRLVAHVIEQGQAFSVKDLAINGRDLLTIGVPQTKVMGAVLKQLTEDVIEDPSLNEREPLLRAAKEYAKLHEDDHSLEQDQGPEGQEDSQAVASSVRQGESQKLAQGDEEAQVEQQPYFPSVLDAQEIHDATVAEHGQAPAPLLRPDVLESAMGRAANHYYYGQGTPQENLSDAAGALAHGMGMSQAFEDGNKRAAYHTTRYMLDQNGLGHVSPFDSDDEELADHLIGHGEGTHSLEDTQQMFRNRLNG